MLHKISALPACKTWHLILILYIAYLTTREVESVESKKRQKYQKTTIEVKINMCPLFRKLHTFSKLKFETIALELDPKSGSKESSDGVCCAARCVCELLYICITKAFY